MTKLPGDLLGRWVRLRERLEGYSAQMEAGEMHIDWSDICVLDAYLTDAWDESYMGPEPGKDEQTSTEVDKYVRAGLLKGRIRTKATPEPSMSRPTFDAALQMATTDDLMYALDLLIKHPNAKRTWRDYRIKHIDKRLREILAQDM